MLIQAVSWWDRLWNLPQTDIYLYIYYISTQEKAAEERGFIDKEFVWTEDEVESTDYVISITTDTKLEE